MIAYSLWVLPLIRNLKSELPDATRPWYTDNARALDMFARIDTNCNSLTLQVPERGYYPKPSKIVLKVHPENLEAGNCSTHVTGLRCEEARVILEVTLGMTSPNAIG